jgi:hypothetical protein
MPEPQWTVDDNSALSFRHDGVDWWLRFEALHSAWSPFADADLAVTAHDALVADVRAARLAWWEHPEHQDFVNELLDRAPESYDGDEAAEAIAIRYVRDLEATARLADDMAAVVRRYEAHWTPVHDGRRPGWWWTKTGKDEPMSPGEVAALHHARQQEGT